ncbi:MAG: 2TM domain-containing protein [Ramlibacter sp.]|jgi:transcriptional regulator with XRE-family HTH domain|uniref:2TM domain-containing protein n=1 Tax=Ramlibacter sp. TaxID=1917967 RepID=UPI00262695A6|nr:2TM domain-containing protein [Ramlibacter sp.]MDH4376495.1 2TM domain-containing protein [Ramlibacter sp.]
MLIQKLRLQRGWSQQQLAQASGLSARTIQRLEAGQPASMETLKSLAAVFEIDYASLHPETPMTPSTANTAEQEEAKAFRQVRQLRAFYLHLAQYVLVCTLLVAINLLTRPSHLWSLWVIGGWGLGVLSHGLQIFNPFRVLGPEWERREVEKRLGRPL